MAIFDEHAAVCEDWEKWSEQDLCVWVLANLHGKTYDGPIMKFCPFCGKELEVTDGSNRYVEEVPE